jgi:DeoR/GlpR family transcriptional regulator of sugar metabolism
MEFITVKTVLKNNEARNVTLAYSNKFNDVYLLGNLEHNTQVIIDQELVDDLQKIVNDMNKNKSV